MDNADCLSSLPESKLGRKRDTSAAPPVSPTVVKRRGHGSALDAYLHNRMVNMQGDKNHQNKPVSAKNIKIQPAGVTTEKSHLGYNTHLQCPRIIDNGGTVFVSGSVKDKRGSNSPIQIDQHSIQRSTIENSNSVSPEISVKRRGRGLSINTILQRTFTNFPPNNEKNVLCSDTLIQTKNTRRGRGPSINTILQKNKENYLPSIDSSKSMPGVDLMSPDSRSGVSVLTSNTPLSLKDTSKKNLDDNTTSGSGKNPKRRGRGPSIMTILQRNKENISENKDIFTGTFKEPLAADLDSAVTTQCNVLRSQNSTMSSNCNLYGRTDLQVVGTNNENEKIIRFTSHNKGKRPIPTDGKTKSPDYKRKNKVVSNDIPSDFREKGSENITPVPISSFMQSNIDTSDDGVL